MPSLEVHNADGTVQERELSRTQPLSIGRQPFNDICIPEDGVGAMHCRVLWNKTSFEVAAAGIGGIEVNGTSVNHARLNTGDVIRVGSFDLIYRDQQVEAAGSTLDPDIILLAEPPSLKSARRNSNKDDDIPSLVETPEESNPKKRNDKGKRPEPMPKPVEELSLFEGAINTPSQIIAARENEDWDSVEGEISSVALKPLPGSHRATPRREKRPGQAEKSATPIRTPGLMMGGRARPGEQDIFQSPLVLGLSVGGLVLLLIAGIFWFLIGREQAARLYDRALAELNDGQYAQSISSFEQFRTQYPGHSLQVQAERGLGKAQIQKEISGATPSWKRGLEQLQAFITAQRNSRDFKDLHPTIFKYAEEISLGAARGAEASRDAELLTISEDAQVILERFAEASSTPAAAINRIKEARVGAIIAISKQKSFDDSMAIIEQALADRKPMVALSERERLVRSFDGFAMLKRVKDALNKALDLERSVVTTDDTERSAETKESQPPAHSLLGLFHTRTRTDETSQGKVAFVLAKDCCYAIDTMTGELVWKRVIGFDAPFFPARVMARQPGLLMYDGRGQWLVCCQPADGALIWRLKLDARPLSAPLVHEGQIYLPTADRGLCRIDLDSGRLTEKVTFSQNVVGPPAISHDGKYLLVAGEMAMIYALSMRPLSAVSTTFTDHGQGAISSPPLSMGRLLLLCDNDKSDSSLLRQWNADKPTNPLVELPTKAFRVRGHVRQPPILRGNQLIVPSSGEQLAAFSVTDDPGREGLVPIAQYRISADESTSERSQEKQDGKDSEKQKQKTEDETTRDNAGSKSRSVPTFVALGSDQQFWVASSAFRRFDIGPDSIHLHSNALAVGIASQQLQLSGDLFFVGRKSVMSDAVTFSAIDRDRMISPWRTVLGAGILELISTAEGGAVGVTESGHLLVFSANRVRDGGIDLKAANELQLPSSVTRPLISSRLHDGKIFLAAAGDPAQLWIINTSGQIEFSTKLPSAETLQANPVLLEGGLVIPLAGRLKYVPVSSGRKPVQEWLAPVGEQATPAWRFLVRLDDDELIACESQGLLTRVQLRTTDVPHLAGVSKLSLDHPVDIAPAARDEVILIAESNGAVSQLNARSFDREGRREFKAPVRGVWSAGNTWLVWAGDRTLSCVSEGRNLPIQWSVPLAELQPVGNPLVDDNQVLLACRNGEVVTLDLATGKEVSRTNLPQSLSMGVIKLGQAKYAVASDGTLYRIDSNGQQLDQPGEPK